MASKTSNIDTVNKSNTPVSIKAKVLQTVTTVNGTLYENEIVRRLRRWWDVKYGMVDGERNNNIYILFNS